MILRQSTKKIDVHLNSQLENLKLVRRQGLIAQLRAIRYLACQGIAIQGHENAKGNLEQLLHTWSCDRIIKKIINIYNMNCITHQY